MTTANAAERDAKGGEAEKVALVTGGAKRIGRSIVVALAKHGFDVAIHYRASAAEAEAVADQVRAMGRRAATLPGDLAIAGDVAGMVPAVTQMLGAPVCLVNNASEFNHDGALDMSEAGFDRHMAVNLRAPVFLARDLARHLPPGVEGNVVNIIDQRVFSPTPDFFSYTLSKTALFTANRMLAQALAPSVRVNAVGPGPVLRSVHQSEDEFAREQRGTLLQRGATPEEIAAAVCFLIETPAMTGQLIALDGGQHLGWR